MKKYLIGFIIGVCLTLATSAFAEQAKQFVLTLAEYPIFVNGDEYIDDELPVLNYNGSTYVPLAKLGYLTGVDYTWNKELFQVEINTDKNTDVNEDNNEADFDPNSQIIRDLAENENIKNFTDNIEIIIDDNTGLKIIGKNEDGTDLIGLQVFDENGNLIGTYTDSDDTNLVLARLNKEPLPPKLTDGWISDDLLSKIYLFNIVYDSNDLVIKTSPVKTQQQEFLRLSLPDEWKEKTSGTITINNVSLQKYNDDNYFSIDDLIKVGVMK